MQMPDNYCSQKFWWLTVEPERRQVLSCCAAYPHKIDLAWLQNNKGNLFNLPILQQERKDMLNNVSVPSCEKTCWQAERQGKISRRLLMDSDNRTHTNITAVPDTVHINLGSDCNLTCVYCTKQYSTSWLKDIYENGAYLDEDRYKISSNDKILLNLKQKKINQTDVYNLIIDEIASYTDCKEVCISGGEPFLHNNLVELVKKFKQKIKIYTGLGVSTNRLERMLSELPDHVEFAVSAENIHQYYEFARYNNSFKKFEQNLKLITKKHSVVFSSTMSNLTIFNFNDFENYYKDYTIELGFCNEPDYLSLNVLDNHSKEMLKEITFNTDDKSIKHMLDQEHTIEQKNNLVVFLKEFVRRRNLDLKIFPTNFVNWLNTPQ
jgi:organic radical activating enzyme